MSSVRQGELPVITEGHFVIGKSEVLTKRDLTNTSIQASLFEGSASTLCLETKKGQLY